MEKSPRGRRLKKNNICRVRVVTHHPNMASVTAKGKNIR